MIFFSFGILLHVLNLFSPKKTTQKYLCSRMFLAVNPNYDISDDDATVSHLKTCTAEISPDVTDYIDTVDVSEIRVCFETEIIPKLFPDKITTAISVLAYIVANAKNIEQNICIGTINPWVRSDYASITNVEPAAFFTDLFVFSVKAVPNKQGITFYQSILSMEQLRRLPFDSSKIQLIKPEKDYAPILTSTVRKKNFDKAFELVSEAKLGVQNDNDIRIYRLRSEDYEFSDTRLKKFLTDNIGRYVFSRAQIEQFRQDEEDRENIGIEAAQYLREHLQGNEFGAMMIYSFLETVLDAPKLFSKVELTPDLGISDGIHLNRISGSFDYQLVYGASDIQGDLKGAVDTAIKRVKRIKDAKPSPYQIVNSASFSQSVPVGETASAIRSILFPSKKGTEPPPTAFGIFLGYSLKMDDSDYSLPLRAFKEKMAQKLDAEIKACVPYITSELNQLKLHLHSYYIYILPLNNADRDKHSIIQKLIGGGER